MIRKFALILIVLLPLGVLAQQASKPDVKKVKAPYTSPASGKEMYTTYCASCHGVDAKGNGPAAPAMKTPPTDLTILSKNSGGKFPSDRVSAILEGKTELAAHGSKDMPVWGKVFWKMSQGHQSEVQQRVYNLSKYLESVQQK